MCKGSVFASVRVWDIEFGSISRSVCLSVGDLALDPRDTNDLLGID